jgi:hypothetical protein
VFPFLRSVVETIRKEAISLWKGFNMQTKFPDTGSSMSKGTGTEWMVHLWIGIFNGSEYIGKKTKVKGPLSIWHTDDNKISNVPHCLHSAQIPKSAVGKCSCKGSENKYFKLIVFVTTTQHCCYNKNAAIAICKWMSMAVFQEHILSDNFIRQKYSSLDFAVIFKSTETILNL